MDIRIGLGFDSHEFEEGKPLYLGGVLLEGYPGLKGHSDGDVILHALTDAVLGAIGEGDIGHFFSDSDPRWRGAPSKVFIEKAIGMMRGKGYRILNTDVVYVGDMPKISEVRERVLKNLSSLLGVEKGRISLKGKRKEGFGDLQGVMCIATVLVAKE